MNRLQFSLWLTDKSVNEFRNRVEWCWFKKNTHSPRTQREKKTNGKSVEKNERIILSYKRDTYSSLSLWNRGPIWILVLFFFFLRFYTLFVGLSFPHSNIAQYAENKATLFEVYRRRWWPRPPNSSMSLAGINWRENQSNFTLYIWCSHFECDETMFWSLLFRFKCIWK